MLNSITQFERVTISATFITTKSSNIVLQLERAVRAFGHFISLARVSGVESRAGRGRGRGPAARARTVGTLCL
ncbi:unnamed protein product [Euphydryas editha]|uniref:Uncharacterized protein n=1 Tax=Euphydryas editha TaxID=104508 RepID=A0AAU9U1I1_EUPED|nr:unnamed protein product [Euphydryas editha]